MSRHIGNHKEKFHIIHPSIHRILTTFQAPCQIMDMGVRKLDIISFLTEIL